MNHPRHTPNGISLADYTRLDCGVYRSDDGLIVALVEPGDKEMHEAIADGAWLVLVERDKARFVQRAGRLQAPHISRLVGLAQADVAELMTWHRSRDGDYAGRSRDLSYDNDDCDLSEIAAALNEAWCIIAAARIRELRTRQDTPLTQQDLRAWLQRGWERAQQPTLLDEIYAEDCGLGAGMSSADTGSNDCR